VERRHPAIDITLERGGTAIDITLKWDGTAIGIPLKCDDAAIDIALKWDDATIGIALKCGSVGLTPMQSGDVCLTSMPPELFMDARTVSRSGGVAGPFGAAAEWAP